MYDKINLWTHKTASTPDISKLLSGVKETISHVTGEVVVTGTLEGLKIYITAGGFSIIGSISGYYYPSNAYILNRCTTAKAIEKLSDSLHMNIKTSKVTGLEFGTQFKMSNPVEFYLPMLGNLSRMHRLQATKKTLYYRMNQRKGKQPKELCLYDKVAQSISHGLILPNRYKESNLLRYEIRYNGRLPQQLKVKEVTASTLFDKAFYSSMVERYKEIYFAIDKQTQLTTNAMNEIKTVKDAFRLVAAEAFNTLGKERTEALITQIKTAGVFDDKKYYSRLRKMVQDVIHNERMTETDELIKELDENIQNIDPNI